MTDFETMAYCGWMEDHTGTSSVQVMHVIWNRVQSPDFPNTVSGVVYQKNAFSFTRLDNPEHGLVPDGLVYNACLRQAPLIIGGEPDPTFGALYYANLETITPNGWFQRNIVDKPVDHWFLLKVGKHSFYA